MFCFGIDSSRLGVRFTMSGSVQYRADQDGQTSTINAYMIDMFCRSIYLRYVSFTI